MRTLSTIATDAAVSFAGIWLAAVLAGPIHAEECSSGRGLTSNDIKFLVGSGDTLWMVTERDNSLAFNMIAGKNALADPTKENNWWSYSLGCKKGGLYDLARGGGFTVASLDTAPNVLWTFDNATSRIKEYTFPWPRDSLPVFTASDAAWASGRFFLACYDGGLVGWDVERNEKTVYLPGRQGGINLSELAISDLPHSTTQVDGAADTIIDTTRRVTGVEIAGNDSLLLVTTPARLWFFSSANLSWDSTIATEFADSTIAFRSFEYTFINLLDRSLPLYAVIAVGSGDEENDSLIFCKYNRATLKWHLMFDLAPKAVSFGPRGYLYTLFDEERPGAPLRNIVRIYRDTLGDSGTLSKNSKPTVSDDRIHSRMTRSHDIDVPDVINDILFIPHSDSGGYLWIATSEGLFFSRSEIPGGAGNDTASFILIKRAPPIASGLKKTYARPGILSPSVGSCKFIYNISKVNTKVTIRVYDYNMDLVKTVIESRVRQPGNQGGPLGRSTVESEDSWDGTNAQGRSVAPGVYYYKITTSTGERSFGKIVVAR